MQRSRQIPLRTRVQSSETVRVARWPGLPKLGGGHRASSWRGPLELCCLILVYGSLGLSGCAQRSLDDQVQAADGKRPAGKSVTRRNTRWFKSVSSIAMENSLVPSKLLTWI